MFPWQVVFWTSYNNIGQVYDCICVISLVCAFGISSLLYFCKMFIFLFDFYNYSNTAHEQQRAFSKYLPVLILHSWCHVCIWTKLYLFTANQMKIMKIVRIPSLYVMFKHLKKSRKGKSAIDLNTSQSTELN